MTSPCDDFSATAHRDAQRVLVAILGLVLALAFALACVSLKWPLVNDAPIMHYIGWRIHQGDVPYRDIFDVQFPGTYFVHWLLLCLPGDIDLNWRLFDVGLLTAIFVVLWTLVSPRGYWSACATCAGCVLFCLALGPDHGGQRDTIMTLLQIGAVLACAAMLEATRPRLWLAFVAGVLFGAAVTIKPFGVVIVVAEGVFVTIWLYRAGHGSRSILSLLAAAAAGFVLPLAGILLWLYRLGGLGAFCDVTLNYTIPIYSICFAQQVTKGSLCLLLCLHYPVNVLLTVAVFLSVYMCTAGHLTARFGLVMTAALAGAAHFVLQQKGWTYHLVPMVAFALAVAFWLLGAWFSGRAIGSWCVGAAVLVLVLTTPVAQGIALTINTFAKENKRHKMVEELAGYLKARVRPGEMVQMIDTTEGGIDALLRAGVKQPTRFLYDMHFFCHDPALPYVAALRKEFVEGLSRHRPRFIVMFRKTFLIHGYQRIEKFPELRDFLGTNYVQRVGGDDYCVFEYKQDGEPDESSPVAPPTPSGQRSD